MTNYLEVGRANTREVQYTVTFEERPIVLKSEPWFPKLYARLTNRRPTSKFVVWVVNHWPHRKVEDLIARRAAELDDLMMEYALNQIWNKN